MEQEEKDLLLKDLSGRLPYGLLVQISDYTTPQRVEAISDDLEVRVNNIFVYSLLYECKPYLRSISSMTEEEQKEYHKTFRAEAYGNGYVYVESVHSFDWLNKHNFDYRGLIEKGLALEAPDDMYN